MAQLMTDHAARPRVGRRHRGHLVGDIAVDPATLLVDSVETTGQILRTRIADGVQKIEHVLAVDLARLVGAYSA